MYLQLADWIIPLIFLSALVLLLKFRPALNSVSRESYNCVASGVVILTIVSVARVYYLNGLFAYIPFLSEPLFYRVVSWIGIITGTLLVVNGMSLWLPLVRKWQQSERNDARYSDFLRKIERLSQVETRAERLTSLALTAMSEHFRISRGLVLRYSRRDNRFDLTGSVPATFCVADSFKSTSLNSQHWRQVIANSSAPVASAVEGLPEQLQNPDVTLPLTLGDQPLGCYLLWLEAGRRLGEEDMNCLRLAVEIIARKVDADRYRLRADYFHQLTLLHERIQETASSAKPLLKNLGAVLAAVHQTLNLDYVSLQIIGTGSRPVTCLTMGANGALLIEKGLASPPDNSPIQQAFLTGRPVFQQEPNRSSSAFPEDRRLAMPSFAAVPLPTETRHNFIFVLSSQTRDGIGWQTARMLQSLGPIVTRMAELAESSASRTGADRVLTELCHLYRTARLERDYGALCRSLASFLKRALPADGVRISAVEPDSPFLQSLALIRPSGVPAETTHDSLMIRSLMPNHDKAIQTGRLALLPSEFSTEPLTATEAAQCLGDKINSMIIAPVPNETGTSTIITVGRSADQGHRPFGRSEILTVRAAADCLAAFGVETPVVPTTEFRPFQINAHSPYPAPELRSRMKSSLSGIIGSVELIKAQGEPGAPSVNRYLSIIDKSAQQMHRYLKQAEPLATSKER
jgi:hypothetical protein